jgi:hypothetical protein
MGSLISPVFVRVELLAKFPILSLDIFFGRIAIDAEDFVVIDITQHKCQ